MKLLPLPGTASVHAGEEPTPLSLGDDAIDVEDAASSPPSSFKPPCSAAGVLLRLMGRMLISAVADTFGDTAVGVGVGVNVDVDSVLWSCAEGCRVGGGCPVWGCGW